MAKEIVDNPEWCELKDKCPVNEMCKEDRNAQLCSRDRSWTATRVARGGDMSFEEAVKECRKYGVKEEWIR